MAAPKFTPMAPTDHPRRYESPDHVPDSWMSERPGEIHGYQPLGRQLGDPGPDQGYALRIANHLRPSLILQPKEHAADVVRGCVAVATRRASMFSRAPMIHDVTIAFTLWGFLDSAPPRELLDLRGKMFEGLRLVTHHYTELRAVADFPPEATLRMTPTEVADAYPGGWRELLGV